MSDLSEQIMGATRRKRERLARWGGRTFMCIETLHGQNCLNVNNRIDPIKACNFTDSGKTAIRKWGMTAKPGDVLRLPDPNDMWRPLMVLVCVSQEGEPDE